MSDVAATREQAIKEAHEAVYALHQFWADKRDSYLPSRGDFDTIQRMIAQAKVDATAEAGQAIRALLPQDTPNPANGG